MSPSSPFKPSQSQLARLQHSWSQMAGEAITVEVIGNSLVGRGTELAVLRLQHQYRNPAARALHSRNLRSWIFVLELNAVTPSHVATVSHDAVRLIVLPDTASHGEFLCIQQHDSSAEVWARTPGATPKDYRQAQRLAHACSVHTELVDTLEQARAALPDAWFAVKCDVPRELIEKLDTIIDKAKA